MSSIMASDGVFEYGALSRSRDDGTKFLVSTLMLGSRRCVCGTGVGSVVMVGV